MATITNTNTSIDYSGAKLAAAFDTHMAVMAQFNSIQLSKMTMKQISKRQAEAKEEAQNDERF